MAAEKPLPEHLHRNDDRTYNTSCEGYDQEITKGYYEKCYKIFRSFINHGLSCDHKWMYDDIDSKIAHCKKEEALILKNILIKNSLNGDLINLLSTSKNIRNIEGSSAKPDVSFFEKLPDIIKVTVFSFLQNRDLNKTEIIKLLKSKDRTSYFLKEKQEGNTR